MFETEIRLITQFHFFISRIIFYSRKRFGVESKVKIFSFSIFGIEMRNQNFFYRSLSSSPVTHSPPVGCRTLAASHRPLAISPGHQLLPSTIDHQTSVVSDRTPAARRRPLDVGCLSVIGCSSPTIGHRRPTTDCLLVTISYWMSIVGLRLLAIRCQLPIAGHQASVVGHPPLAIRLRPPDFGRRTSEFGRRPPDAGL